METKLRIGQKVRINENADTVMSYGGSYTRWVESMEVQKRLILGKIGEIIGISNCAIIVRLPGIKICWNYNIDCVTPVKKATRTRSTGIRLNQLIPMKTKVRIKSNFSNSLKHPPRKEHWGKVFKVNRTSSFSPFPLTLNSINNNLLRNIPFKLDELDPAYGVKKI